MYHMRARFDVEALDPEDPFEIDDGNRPHLFKHVGAARRSIAIGPPELYDIYVADLPLFYPGREDGEADWLMVGSVPELVLVAPLAPPRNGDPSMCRPIGLYSTSRALRQRYRDDTR